MYSRSQDYDHSVNSTDSAVLTVPVPIRAWFKNQHRLGKNGTDISSAVCISVSIGGKNVKFLPQPLLVVLHLIGQPPHLQKVSPSNQFLQMRFGNCKRREATQETSPAKVSSASNQFLKTRFANEARNFIFVLKALKFLEIFYFWT